MSCQEIQPVSETVQMYNKIARLCTGRTKKMIFL